MVMTKENNNFQINGDGLNNNAEPIRPTVKIVDKGHLPMPQDSTSDLDLVESRAKWEKLRKYAKEGKQFVLMIGLAGAAKTVITSSLVYASMVKYGLRVRGIRKDRDGPAHLSKMINHLLSGSFPPGNPVFGLEYYDTVIYYGSKPMPITFIEMSGENLAQFDPENLDKNPFFRELEAFLELDPKLVTFLVAPANHKSNPSKKDNSSKVQNLDIFFQLCLAHLFEINEKLTSRLGLIISKWDTLGKGANRINLEKFIKKNHPATWNGMVKKHEIDHSRFFKFSIGKVDETGATINGDIRLADCYPILDWIHALFVKQPSMTQITQLEEQVLGIDGELDKAIFRTENNGKRIDVLTKNQNKKAPAKRGVWSYLFHLLTL